MEIVKNNKIISDQEINTSAELNRLKQAINDKEEYRKELEYSKAVLEETKANYAQSNIELDRAKDTIKDLLEEQENLKKKHSSEILSKDMEIMKNNKIISDQEINTSAELNRLKQTIKEQNQNHQSKDDKIEELNRYGPIKIENTT